MEAILQFVDDGAKAAAFDHCWAHLETAGSYRINIDTLKTCVRLLPPSAPDQSAPLAYYKLQELVFNCLSHGHNDAEYQYLLAETCLSNTRLTLLVYGRLMEFVIMTKKQLHLSEDLDSVEQEAQSSRLEEDLQKFQSCLRFLRSSYWLSSSCYHYVAPDLLDLLISCFGIDALDNDAHDTLSALLQLLSKPPVTVINWRELPTDWLDVRSGSNEPVLSARIINDGLFRKFRLLPPQYFSANTAKVFRTWFQWISHAHMNNIEIKALFSSFYWSWLRAGLVAGFSDQRKYCLGILRTSLLIPQEPINLPQMELDPHRRLDYVAQYERYSTLFEIIVLDRYANQVQACLTDLSSLLGPDSLISANWSTALLSAALNPKVQDGIRKLVGNWYLDHVIKRRGSISEHAIFLVEGFLPWATQGSLFTASLTSTRRDTHCVHGTAVANLIATFLKDTHPDESRRELLVGVLDFVLRSGGKVFSPSVLYLLEGLLKGLETQPLALGTAEFETILRVSRLPALPEIGTDLCITYFAKLTGYVDPGVLLPEDRSAYEALTRGLDGPMQGNLDDLGSVNEAHDSVTSLSDFMKQLEISRHKCVQDAEFGPACSRLLAVLDKKDRAAVSSSELYESLYALWQEADRRDFPRAVVASIMPLLFHTACAYACARDHVQEHSHSEESLATLLSTALEHFQRMAQGRPYILAVLATSLRSLGFINPSVVGILPVCSTLVQFINTPPAPQKEFLFEVAAAQKLQKFFPERDYSAYYGQREWIGFAAIIDMLNRIPKVQLSTARELMDRLLEPWRTQKAPIPIISKWKNVLQLQIMLLLTESCVSEENAETYLEGFMDALVPEQWPRYRFLLEWIISRVYYHFPSKADRILNDLDKLDENSPAHIASLIRISNLCAPFLNSEKFALNMLIRLIPLSASPKVQIRHEAHWSFPALFGLAVERNWASITSNPAFQALDDHVRSLDRFTAEPTTIRGLRLDVVRDFNITDIFQGRYLSIETPEYERVAQEDFMQLYENDETNLAGINIPAARVPLGNQATEENTDKPASSEETQQPASIQSSDANPTMFQTKSGFDIASLLPSSGSPSTQQKRPTSVILIASLIDNPTNLGGLSRISESFGLEALYIDDLRKQVHKDFKATSVTSEKHLPIHELKIATVPDFITSLKRQGYEVVGIEQTDRSGVLGENEQGDKDLGMLPEKCVLVLGSERGGISSEVLAVVDRCVEIKTVGVTRSLNVQTAGGIAVYEWWREWGGKL